MENNVMWVLIKNLQVGDVLVGYDTEQVISALTPVREDVVMIETDEYNAYWMNKEASTRIRWRE